MDIRRASEVDLDRLSPRGQAIAQEVGMRMVQGYSAHEIARTLGVPSYHVEELLDELRAEIRHQSESLT